MSQYSRMMLIKYASYNSRCSVKINKFDICEVSDQDKKIYTQCISYYIVSSYIYLFIINGFVEFGYNNGIGSEAVMIRIIILYTVIDE